MTAPYIIIEATGVVPQTNNDPSDTLPGVFDATNTGSAGQLGPRLQTASPWASATSAPSRSP